MASAPADKTSHLAPAGVEEVNLVIISIHWSGETK